jgi:hypothetical protein
MIIYVCLEKMIRILNIEVWTLYFIEPFVKNKSRYIDNNKSQSI